MIKYTCDICGDVKSATDIIAKVDVSLSTTLKIKRTNVRTSMITIEINKDASNPPEHVCTACLLKDAIQALEMKLGEIKGAPKCTQLAK